MTRNKITISFLPKDTEIWNFIQSKKGAYNVSDYIRNLIRQDMNKDSTVDEARIVEKILEAIQKNPIIPPYNERESIEDILANEEAKNTINSLF